MNEATKSRVVVTVELTTDPEAGPGHVEGTVSAAGRDPRPFSGWLALLELLELSAAERPAKR